MRLTSPRWASNIVKGAGRDQPLAVVNLLHSFTNHDIKRRDVINPGLCHEALDLLRPSLPPPSSCDIIDVNPGAGVWSQALHQVLKPRRHVLVETEYENYHDALSPLLETNESYRIAPTIVDALDENQDFLSPDLRTRIASLSQDECSAQIQTRQPSSQLIVTANLAHKVVKSNGFSGEMSKLFIEHYYRSMAMNTGAFAWHKYGLIRLLAWVPEADKNSFSPRSTSFRYRASKQLEAAFEVREIVSSFPNDGRRTQYRPWHGAALQSVEEVAQIQSASNIEIPPHRQQPRPDPPSIFLSPVEQNFKFLQSLKGRPPLVDQYITAYRDLKSSDPAFLNHFLDNGTVKLYGNPSKLEKNDPRRIFSQMHARMRTTHGRYAKVDDLARDQIALEQQLVACRKDYPDQPERYLALLKQLQPQFEAVKQKILSFFKDNRQAVKKAIDDYRALAHSPHVLSWNNRKFEPLLCHPKTDFFPHQPMTLFEFTPRPEFIETINTADRQIIWDYISHHFDFSRQKSVKEAIEQLVGSGEAYDRFVGTFGDPAAIPSLTDPLYGGYHDLSDVRLRGLSVRQLVEISLAYEKWPWRMKLNDILEAVSRLGSGVGSGRRVV